MDTKNILDLHDIQKTLLYPLWGRSIFSSLYPEILNDKEAISIAKSLNYDFSNIEKAFGEYGGLLYIVRGQKIDETIKNFILKNPKATVVNIGAGLDTTFSRIDNGSIYWYDLDIEEVIAIRKSIIPEGPRNKCIAKSVLDYSWFKDIHFNVNDGILFIASGVFYYFKENDVKELFITLANNFPGGELFFDGQTKITLKLSNRMVQKSGNMGAMMYFYVKNKKIFSFWSPLLNLQSVEPFCKNLKVDKRWKKTTRIKMFLCNFFKMASFYHIKFSKTNL
ncbi:MAG: class I SAM-dependent methyltransferase [Clostridiales Family XIII bacterium]|jgi:O-methyltransferase involved in polyketide biosynthesis|nr:class I SAM-dependent methyltransferase [Clostridiales Family XIII bacterium]